MVVREALPVVTTSSGVTSAMLTASNNGQYINPDDILNPLDSNSMDPKSSPLAMLAKTCSQIGADPLPPLSKLSKPKTPEYTKTDSLSPSTTTNLSTIRKESRSRSSSAEIKVSDTIAVKSDTKRGTMPIEPTAASLQIPKAVPPTVSYPTISTSSSSIMKNNNTSTCTRNNPFLASFASQLSPPPQGVNEVCRDPLCRDPLCPTALRNQQFLGAAASSGSYSSYASLLASSPHYREAMMVMAAQHRMMASMNTTSSPHTNGSLPHVCGWMLGSEYCGRRFASAEELLVHLKTHTSLSTSDPRALLLNGASSSNNTTSSSSGARFHPYARLSPNVPPPPPPVAPVITSPLPPPPPSLSLAAFASSPYASLYSSLFTRSPLL